MNKKLPYTGTKVWFISFDFQQDLAVHSEYIPLWMGGVIKWKLCCRKWFAYHTVVLNKQTYTITYDSDEIRLKPSIMISKIQDGIYVDLDYITEDVMEYAKTWLKPNYKII